MDTDISEGETFRPNIYMSSTRFEVILSLICYTDRENIEYNDGFFHMRQMKGS